MIDVDNLDWSRCTYPPYDHQIEGVKFLIKEDYCGLLDQMGMGKTKQIIDTACFLYNDGQIDIVLIMCPAQVKNVWAHPVYSQIVEHSWVKGILHEFTSRSTNLPSTDNGLLWVVVSIELLRQEKHTTKLIKLLKGRRTWAVVDESTTIANHKASQTKAILRIGPHACRRTIATGTPVGQSPLGLYSQFQFVHPNILGFKNYYQFRNKHARMGGYLNKQVIGFEDLESVQRKIKPHVIRRLKEHCLDIPPKIRLPLREVRLGHITWFKYCQMRDELVAYLSNGDASVVSTAPVKTMRLAQLCSGFLGGILEEDSMEYQTVEVSSELTDDFLDNLGARIGFDNNYRLIVWCRFRAEIARLATRAKERFPNLLVRVLQGGLSKSDRQEAETLFHPSAPDISGPALLVGQPQAARFGHNFAKCFNVDYLSNDFSYLTRCQSEDRVHRPGQTQKTLFQDYVVVGPNRERTVSGMILKALRLHEEMATWTCSRWVKELVQENSDDIPF